MEEPGSGKQAVARSERSCESECNTEMILNCSAMSENTLFNESSKSETDAHSSHMELNKNFENQSFALSLLAQKYLDECTKITDDDTSVRESVTNIKSGDLENVTPSFEIHSNIESTSHNVTNHCISTIDNIRVHSDDKMLESSERCNISIEKDKQELAADNNFEIKCIDNEQKILKKLLSASVEKSIQEITRDIKSEPAELSSNDAVSQATQEKQIEGTHLPKYILVKRKTLQPQDASRKPGSKLTSLLQRLTAGKGCVTVPDNSILYASRMSPKSLLSQKEADPVISQSHPLESSLFSHTCAEFSNTEQTAPQHSIKNATSSATNDIPVSLIQIQHNAVTNKAKITVKLPPQTHDSPTSQHRRKRATNSSKVQTKLVQKDNVPIKIIKSTESLQYGLKNRSNELNEAISLPLQQNKPSESSPKTSAHFLSDYGNANEPKMYTKSVESSPYESLGHKTLISTDKGKYVIDYASLKMLAQSAGFKLHNPSDQGALESDPKPFNLQNISTKTKKLPKHQFSLLKQSSTKHFVQSNTSACVVSKVPTVYSFLSNSPTAPIISPKSPDHSTSDLSRAKNKTSILVSPVAMQDLTKTAVVPGSGALILTPHSNPGQIFFHSLPNTAVRSSNSQTLGISASAFSNLTAAISKKGKVKTTIAPSASLFTSTSQTVIAVPPSAVATPMTTILAISSSANSNINIPDGICSISSATSKVKTVKTTSSSTDIPKLNQKQLRKTDTCQNYSNLITKIALKSLSQTSARTSATSLQTSLTPTQAEDRLPSNETALEKSVFKISASNVLTVSEILQALKASKSSFATSKTMQTPEVLPKTSHTYIETKTSKAPIISETAHMSVTTPTTDSSNVCTSVPSCSKPVKVTASRPENIPSIRLLPQNFKLILPAVKKKKISLLDMPSTPTILYSTSASTESAENIATATATQVKRKLKSKAEKSLKNKILEQNTLELSSKSSFLNPNSRIISSEMNKRTPRKPRKNAVYSTTVGQDPVSVMVVAPDIEDGSSDTISETGVSYLTSQVESKLDKQVGGGFHNSQKLPEKSEALCRDIPDNAAYRKDNLPDKDLEARMWKLSSLEETGTSNESGLRFQIVDKTESDMLSDIKFSHSRCFKEEETSYHGTHHVSASLDDEETDSDVDMGSFEEQDMSVLRQLLKSKDSIGLHSLSSRHLQIEPETAHDTINRHFNVESIHKTYSTSCSEKSENKLSNKPGSIQQLLLSSPFTQNLQNDVLDQTVKQQPVESDSCGLKIESIFSLSNNAELEESEFTADSNFQENDPTVLNGQSFVFNVRESEDWKNFVNPCFVVLERLPRAQVLAKGSSEIQPKCTEHCRNRTLHYLCKLNLLKCANHPEATSFLKPISRNAMKKSFRRNVKHEIVRQEMSETELYSQYPPLFSDLKQNHESDELYSQYPPLFSDLKQKLPYNKPLADISLLNPIGDTKQTSEISGTDNFEMETNNSSDHNGKKIDITISPSLDKFTTNQDLKKFHSGLKRLQKQVNRKRAKMLNQKLNNKANEKLQAKSVTKPKRNKPRTLPLTTNLNVPTKVKRYTPTNRTIPTKAVVLEKMSSPEQNTSNLLNVSHHISSKKKGEPSEMIPSSAIRKSSTCKRGISLLPANNTTQQTSKIPIPKLKNGVFNVVSIQPKMQPFPVEKVKAALESLNSYLESTGRKPTNDNTQYILLKIDDQHILVKLPFTNVSTEQLSNIKFSNMKTVPAITNINHSFLGGVTSPVCQQMQSSTDTSMVKSISSFGSANNAFSTNNTTTVVANMNTAATVNTNSAFITLKTASNTAPSIKKRTSSNTSSLVSSTAEPNLSVLKTTSTTDTSVKFKKTAKSAKLPRSFFVPIQKIPPKKKSAVDTPMNIGHSSVTNRVRAHPAMISLLAPVIPSHSQSNMAVIKPVCQMKNVSRDSPSPLPLIISALDIPGSSMKTANEEPNTVLSNLPLSSSLLPERKRKSVILSEEAKELKRRRLEAKYPLPPGIIIKSEPDNLDYELGAQWAVAPEASDNGSFPVMITENTLIKESPEKYRQNQALDLVNSENTGSFLSVTSDRGLETQDMLVRNVPAGSPSNMEEMLPEEQCENKEDSSDELDEPPALVEEAISDEESHQTHGVIDTQEDMPPVLQPMFTSSSLSFEEDIDIMKIENTCLNKEKSVYMNTVNSCETNQLTSPTDSNKASNSTSVTSLYSENSMDSGIDSKNPSNSNSYTSVKYITTPATEKSICKNLKIQHLKELLKKKEMEIENMKKLSSEFPSLDLDHI